jgi:hypothetical protein
MLRQLGKVEERYDAAASRAPGTDAQARDVSAADVD